MDILRNDLYIIKESNINRGLLVVPPKEIYLEPKMVTFGEKIIFESFEDKKYDASDIARIPCYSSIERAIQLANKKNNYTSHYDVYCPYENREDVNSFYPYEYLHKRGLISEKSTMNRESWFVKPTKFRYVGTIRLLANDKYEQVVKDYNISDLDKDYFLEGNYIENTIARDEMKNKTTLFNCSYERKRIIYPDQINYGNRISKQRMSSYWWLNGTNAILNFIMKHLINKGVIDYDDCAWLFRIGKLFIHESLKDSVMKEILSMDFYLNVVELPTYSIFSGKHMGFGWDIKDYSYTYDKSIYVDTVHQVNKDDIIPNIKFVNDKKLADMKKAAYVDYKERSASHWLIFDKKD